MTVQIELARILIRETDDTHVVELREVGVPEDQARVFPIVIGLHEAAAIERRLLEQAPARPQTHELLDNTLDALGFELERVVIRDLKDHTFFASLHLRRGDETHEIDSRPSDALALAVGRSSPIHVATHVLEEVSWPVE